MTPEPGRVVALDWGSVRVGVAVSDPLGLTARPHSVLERRSRAKDLRAIADLAAEVEAVRIVVGHPLRLSGEAGDAAREAEAFAEALRATVSIPVDLWDERLTTAQATRAMIEGGASRARRRESVDAVAAALLLQSWLDARERQAPSSRT